MMKIKYLTILTLFLFTSNLSFAQSLENDYERSWEEEEELKEKYLWSYQKEVGLNFTPLISTLVPFNLGDNDAGFTNFSFKKYGRKFGFRINAGIDLDDNDDGDGFVLLNLGFEKRRNITKKITLATGMDFGLLGFLDEGFFNISTFYGFEYNINEKLFIATEANIQLLMGSGLQFRINPPVAIFFFVRV